MMKRLNTRDVKRLRQRLEDQFGFSGELEGIFLLSEKKGRVYVLSPDADGIPYDELRIDSIGLYLGSLMPDDSFRLSIEGSQIVGSRCTKNILLVDEASAKSWLKGETLEVGEDVEGLVIVACRSTVTGRTDYIGCGKVVVKEPRQLLNYVPKTRWVRAD